MKKAEIPELKTLRPDPKREHKTGRYLLPDPGTGDVVGWDRATTLAGLHEDHKALEKWQMRGVLEGVTYDPSLLAKVPDLVETIENATTWRESKPAKDKLDQLAATAHDLAGGNDGNKWGTLLHTITEWADAGRLDEVLPEIKSWGEIGESLLMQVELYQKTMASNGLICPPEYIETICINTVCRSAGTMDRMILLPDGQLWIGDLKTQKSMGFGAVLKIAAQLAEYAFADALIRPDGSLAPMPPELVQTHALIMWLPVHGNECTLIELGPQEMEHGWALAQHAAQTLWFRQIADGVRGRPYDPSCVTTRAGLLSEISHAESPAALTSIWRRYSPAQRAALWTDAHTAAAQSRKAELIKLGIR